MLILTFVYIDDFCLKNDRSVEVILFSSFCKKEFDKVTKSRHAIF